QNVRIAFDHGDIARCHGTLPGLVNSINVFALGKERGVARVIVLRRPVRKRGSWEDAAPEPDGFAVAAPDRKDYPVPKTIVVPGPLLALCQESHLFQHFRG